MICVEGKEGGKMRRERRESDRCGGGEETVEQVSRMGECEGGEEEQQQHRDEGEAQPGRQSLTAACTFRCSGAAAGPVEPQLDQWSCSGDAAGPVELQLD